MCPRKLHGSAMRMQSGWRAHGGFDGAQGGNADQLGEIEAETVHAVALNQPKQAVGDESFAHRAVGAVIVPATAPIREIAVKIEIEVIIFIDAEKVIRLADVIVDDVENHGETLFVKRVHEVAKFFELRCFGGNARVGGRGRKPVVRHVAPVIILRFFGIKLLHGLKLDGVHAEFFQITIVGAHPFREIAKTERTLQIAIFRVLRDEIPQMRFDDDEIGKMRRGEFFFG